MRLILTDIPIKNEIQAHAQERDEKKTKKKKWLRKLLIQRESRWRK